MHTIRVCNIDNQVIAKRIESILKEDNIPFSILQNSVSQFNGVAELQDGWGYIEAPEEYKQYILDCIENLKEYTEEDMKQNQESQNRKINSKNVFMCLIISALVLVLCYSIYRNYKLDKFLSSTRKNYDTEIFGSGYVTVYKENENCRIKYFDDNKDTNFERTELYDLHGKLYLVQEDKNENGINEKNYVYSSDGELLSESTDLDEDLRFDNSIEYISDTKYMKWIDTNNDSLFEVIEIYENGKKIRTINYKKELGIDE